MPNDNRILTGKYLNELWNVGAKHALYRKDGKWYHQLRDFPGALFDANGYIIFETEDEYRESPYLKIQQDLHVPNGISVMPKYVRVTEKDQIQTLSNQIKKIAERAPKYNTKGTKESSVRVPKVPKAIDLPEELDEVKRALSQIYRIIRDTNIAQWVKYLHKYECQICGNTIKLSNDRFYAEAHHIKPLGGKHNGPDVVENILCVCPYHHVHLDYGVISLEKSKLRLIAGHEINDEYIEYHNTLIYKHVAY